MPPENEKCDVRLLDQNRLLKTIIDAAPAMVAYWDSKLCCRHANRAYLEWFGMAPEALIGKTMPQVLGDELFRLNEPYIRGALAGKAQRFERTLTKADGSIGYTLANYVPDFDNRGSVAGFSVLVSDITPLKLAEFQTVKVQERLSAVLDSVHDAIVTFEEDWTILSMNPAGLRMLGYLHDEVIGKNLLRLLQCTPAASLISGSADPAPASLAIALSQERELTGLKSDGQRIPIDLYVNRIGALEEKLYVGVIRDVTLQRAIHQQLSNMARQDGLTGLANRRHFDEVLAQDLHVHIRSGTELSLLLIDIDFFKQYNDRYGHVAGDACLQQIANAIGRVMTRTTDLAARYGGEEFACILPMTNQDGAVSIAQQIQHEIASLAIEHDVAGATKLVTVSIGAATANSALELSNEQIVRLADTQLYAAKKHGRNQVQAVLLNPETLRNWPWL